MSYEMNTGNFRIEDYLHRKGYVGKGNSNSFPRYVPDRISVPDGRYSEGGLYKIAQSQKYPYENDPFKIPHLPEINLAA